MNTIKICQKEKEDRTYLQNINFKARLTLLKHLSCVGINEPLYWKVKALKNK